MTTTTETTADRKATKLGIALGNAGGLAIYVAGYFACPSIATTPTPEGRLVFAVWLCAVPALFVYAVFQSCLRLRDTPEAVNPMLAAESPRWKINQRVLTNSVEQLAIFVPLVLALATRVDAAHVKLVPLHIALWVAARIAFWVGYRRSPAWRAPGMAWTHQVTLLTIAWLVWFSVI
jgi:uncharacterized membrane protein YecN with MAPEG domain